MPNSEIDCALGRRIRARRQKLGLTMQDVAERVGVRQQQISKYEIGQNRISAANLFMISRVLDMHIASIFEGLVQ